MKNRVFFLFLLVLLLGLLVPVNLPGLSHAEQQPNRPKIGLVLGGGGAKGSAHIGVLKVLEELKVPVDFIGGTSMGAVVGSLYASGMSPDEIERTLTSVNWDDLFTDSPPRSEIDFWRKRDDITILAPMELGIKEGGVRMQRGFIAGQKIALLFEVLLMPVSDITDFDKLPTPYRAVAADLETGQAVVLKSGRLADAARASMSVPGVFPPVEVNGRLLADGGIVRNLPVDIVRSMGADIIIAVDVGKPLPPKEKLESMLAISSQMVDIMIKSNVQTQIEGLKERDIFMRPDLGTIESGDFQRGKEAIERGLKAAREKEAALRKLSVTDGEYAVYRIRHQRKTQESVKVGEVAIEGLSRVSPEAVRSKLDIEPGQEIGIDELKHRIGTVYGTGNFEQVSLEAKRRDDVYDLIVRAKEKSWGHNYLRWGLSLASTGKGESSYYILGDYTMRWINRLGAEWKNQVMFGSNQRLLSEFYQPLEHSRTFFVSARGLWEQRPVDLYQENNIIAQYRIQKTVAGMDFGIQPWSYGEIRLGYERGSGSQSLYRGTLELPRKDVDFSAFRGRVVADQLDNVKFPHTGYAGLIDYYDSLPGLGADDRYRKIEVSFLKAFTYQSYTVLASARYGSHINSTIPFYDQFTLGGFLNLSGYQPTQLRGQKVVLGRLIAYWRAYRSMLGSFYTGASLETGNVRQTGQSVAANDLVMAGSVFIGHETFLGPLYLGYGIAERGVSSFYFYLGRVFY